MSKSLHATPGATAEEDATYGKITRRLMPWLLVAFVIAFLDRTNIGYAQLQMKQSLSFSDAAYGLGAGIFFIGYVLFEVPSNLILQRIGVRRTLLRIMVCWGLVACAMAFVTTPSQFYILRFLLGAFEAGFFPGIILYFTYWYPSWRRGKVVSVFMLAPVLAGAIAGPFCGAILKYMDATGGWHGWQWLFVIQGFPAVVFGVLIYLVLPDRPQGASWLTSREIDLVNQNLARDKASTPVGNHRMTQAIRDPKVYMFALIYALIIGCNYVLAFWMPTLIHSWGVGDLLHVGLYATIPSLLAMIAMVVVGRSSDRHRERRWHFVGCALVGVVGLLTATQVSGSLGWSIVALSVLSAGLGCTTPLLATIISEYFSTRLAAAGIALVTSLGNLGPIVVPSLTGFIIQRTGHVNSALYFMIGMLTSAAFLLALTFKSNGWKRAGRNAAADITETQSV